ncbi:molybdopterin molybdotransferase MoeA [Nitrospirillum viridazoti]|uniref:Molybdopterin molybdenumtransferase n=1 Tax=Nitrospirillum viridazoti CBAmc TaxID=1441467 RepID=A0A248JRQ3_9PROT|nr:gephyrin-like molybdotransferase Glp [Nitrospirillum amazonense]ASG20758.1 molybdopterin molybdenumtransferase MoeA [Nitrospirillum amazonense CBAmc]TWB37914.1 molybdopterin molybdochelatase [Nitrospirillum amazonense]
MIPVDEALARILAQFQPLAGELVGVGEAVGRVLAADVVARVTQPPAAVSAMDGWAVRGSDLGTLPVTLARIGEAPAGRPFAGTVAPGQAVRLFTGSIIPDGADTVVLQEDCDDLGGGVRVREGTPGRWVRAAGLDFTAGTVGLKAGRPLTVRDVALAAAMNHPFLTVYRRPRVAILATGDEVVMPGEPLGAGQIVSSNGLALAALVRRHGGTPVNLGIAPDDADTLATLARGAAGCDLLVTTGGASVGEYDLVRDMLGGQDLDLDFWKIAMRPGKPLMFGRLGGTPLLGLPGNPVSSLVCATLFLVPSLRRMQGLAAAELPRARAVLANALPANDRRQDYLRATLTAGDGALPAVATFTQQDSSMLSRLAAADCLIIRPPHAPAAEAGTVVDIVPLDGI